MKRSLLTFAALAMLTVTSFGCGAPNGNIGKDGVTLEYDFREGTLGWEHGFAEYSPQMDIQKEAGIKPLPEELGVDGTGYYLQSMNRSDDVFMFLKKLVGVDDGIIPGQTYRVIYHVTFASDAPSGAVGIGGAPGESVFFKVGATPVEPEVKIESIANYEYYVMTVDKGAGNSGSGPAASEAGHIANGIPAEEFDFGNPTFASVEIEHEHEYNVTADENGDLWLLIGTDSGFEGLTRLYYQSVSVTIEPVD